MDNQENDLKLSTEVESQGLPLDHALLQKAQDQLYAQLLELDNQVTLELQVSTNALDQRTKERESSGLELYQLQHQLAKFQTSYEALEQTYEDTAALHKEIEKDRKSLEEKYNNISKDHAKNEVKLQEQRSKQNKARHTLFQLKEREKEVDASLQVSKRCVSKTSSDLIQVATEKQRQDYQIDELVRQLADVDTEIALYEYRISTQTSNKDRIAASMHEVTVEMEAIAFEKTQLLKHWKSGLSALDRRDELLRSIQEEFRKEQNTLTKMTLELSGAQEALVATYNCCEELQERLTKVKSDLSANESQMEALEDRKVKFEASFKDTAKSLEVTEQKLKKQTKIARAREHELESATLENQRILNSKQLIELEIAKESQKQISLNKQLAGTTRDGVKLKEKIIEKQNLNDRLVNDITRRELEVENLKISNQQLAQTVAEIDKKIDTENAMIASQDLSLKKQFDIVSRKQAEMVALNKKYDTVVAALVAKSGEIQGEIGPMEAAAQSVTRDIANLELKSQELQREWLKVQYTLVTASGQVSELESTLAASVNRKAVMEHSRRVTENKISEEEQNIRNLERDIKQLQRDMDKVNRLLSAHEKSESRLSEATLVLEADLRARLRESELTNLKIEDDIQITEQEKMDVADDLKHTEQEILVWERRLRLVKETKEALDPKFSGNEIQELVKSIERSKQEIQNLLKKQRALCASMEQAITRNGEMAKTAMQLDMGKQAGTAKKAHERAVLDLKRRIKSVEQSLAQEKMVKEDLLKQQQNFEHEIESTKRQRLELEKYAAQIEVEISSLTSIKNHGRMKLALTQGHAKRYEELKNGTYKPAVAAGVDPKVVIDKYLGKIDALKQCSQEICNRMAKEQQKQMTESGLFVKESFFAE